ncbi:MAG: hypothetical protein C4293_10940 [Nitrospiraceae bacterium]
MKPSLLVAVAIVFLPLATPAFVVANPAMLPKHPGYPSAGEFANDTGQQNLTAEQSRLQAAAAEDSHTVQNLSDVNNQRVLESQGAGQLPKVEGPNISIEPPVAEATRMPQ